MESTTEPVVTDDPPRKKHRDDDDVLALWNLHESPYAGLLTGDGFRWNEETQDFASDTGTRLGHNQLRSIAIHFATACELDLENNAALLANGDIDVDEWHRRAQQTVDDEYILMAALGVGGLDKLTDEDHAVIVGEPSTPDKIGSGIADAQARLATFAEELKAAPPEGAPAGQMGEAGSHAQIINRAGQYGRAYSIYEAGRFNSWSRLAQDAGLKLQTLNVLELAADHCKDGLYTLGCVTVTEAGWQDAGVMPKPGERTCGSGCLCTTRFRLVPKDADESEDESV